MRWSEFVEKECVNMDTGEKLGTFHRCDLLINQETGQINTILMPVGGSLFRRKGTEISLKWSMIKKIGPELIIIQQRSYQPELEQ